MAEAAVHTRHVSVRLRDNVIGCAIGASAARNILREPDVSLFWPPNESGGYAMIVNGVASSTRARTARPWRRSSSRNRSFIVGVRSRPTAMDLARPIVSQLPGLNSGRWIFLHEQLVRPLSAVFRTQSVCEIKVVPSLHEVRFLCKADIAVFSLAAGQAPKS